MNKKKMWRMSSNDKSRPNYMKKGTLGSEQGTISRSWSRSKKSTSLLAHRRLTFITSAYHFSLHKTFEGKDAGGNNVPSLVS